MPTNIPLEVTWGLWLQLALNLPIKCTMYILGTYIRPTYVYMSHMTVLPEVAGSEDDNWVTLERELCCLLSVGCGLLTTNVWSCVFGTPIWSDFDLQWPKAFLTLGAKVVLPTVVSCGWALLRLDVSNKLFPSTTSFLRWSKLSLRLPVLLALLIVWIFSSVWPSNHVAGLTAFSSLSRTAERAACANVAFTFCAILDDSVVFKPPTNKTFLSLALSIPWDV